MDLNLIQLIQRWSNKFQFCKKVRESSSNPVVSMSNKEECVAQKLLCNTEKKERQVTVNSRKELFVWFSGSVLFAVNWEVPLVPFFAKFPYNAAAESPK